MHLSISISDQRSPAVVAAVLALHPRPVDAEDPRHVPGEDDEQWVQRVLRHRFRRTLVAIMKKARREGLSTVDPGIPDEAL